MSLLLLSNLLVLGVLLVVLLPSLLSGSLELHGKLVVGGLLSSLLLR